MRILLKEKKGNSEEYRKMLQFLKKNKKSITALKKLPVKYKLFLIMAR